MTKVYTSSLKFEVRDVRRDGNHVIFPSRSELRVADSGSRFRAIFSDPDECDTCGETEFRHSDRVNGDVRRFRTSEIDVRINVPSTVKYGRGAPPLKILEYKHLIIPKNPGRPRARGSSRLPGVPNAPKVPEDPHGPPKTPCVPKVPNGRRFPSAPKIFVLPNTPSPQTPSAPRAPRNVTIVPIKPASVPIKTPKPPVLPKDPVARPAAPKARQIPEVPDYDAFFDFPNFPDIPDFPRFRSFPEVPDKLVKVPVRPKLPKVPQPGKGKLGEKGSGIRARGEVQDYEKIKAECLANGTLWEDPEFPAEDVSIFYSRSPPRPFEWKRPHELVDDPQFFVEGASRFDVKQGELGDCWLLAATANLTLNPKLFSMVVPEGQSFADNYAGIYHFRFWQYGRWVDVVVDDRLPTYYGRLVFLHSEEKNEFWSALLEKAYAKLHGSYEALKGGTTVEAMEDFTGGVTEMYDLAEAPPNLFNIMEKAYERNSLMGCSIDPDPNVVEAEMPNGLIKGHAYSVTKVCHINIQTPRVSGKIPMVRIRNPWGNEAEWKGAWGDSSPEWQFIDAEQRQEIGLTFDTDGEFWMSFKDFMKNFMRLEICNLNPDSLDEDDAAEADDDKKKWEMSVFEGAWVRGSTAGGCRNYIDSFWYNPQYRITLLDPDDDDEEEKCSILIALMQKNRRSQRKLGLECLTIGFAIYHLSDPDGVPKPLDLDFFRYNASVGRSPSFINLREVSCRFKLPPGTYCIVPSTFEPNEEGEFLLRVFSEHSNNMEEHDEEVGITEASDEVREENEKPEETEMDRTVRAFFKKIAGEDLEIDWRELQEVLNYALKKEFEFEGFSKDVCRSMIAMLDVDRSGKLGLEEFKGLWLTIRMWKNVFKMYDHDNSGTLNTFELRRALVSAGYHLNSHILNALVLRFGNKEGRITFDDFVACAVKLKTMIETFNDRVAEGDKKAEFSLEEWVELTMYS